MSAHVLPPLAVNSKAERKVISLPPLEFTVHFKETSTGKQQQQQQKQQQKTVEQQMNTSC
jgi:hypothetical protein